MATTANQETFLWSSLALHPDNGQGLVAKGRRKGWRLLQRQMPPLQMQLPLHPHHWMPLLQPCQPFWTPPQPARTCLPL